MSPKPPAPGHSHKHTGTRKHQQHAKHNPKHHPKPPGWSGGGGTVVHVKSRHGKHAKARGWSPGSDVACCSAEAVGTLLGWDWDQVLALYWRTASDADSGASILDTLQAAAQWRERDLNPRHPGYEPGALTELRHPAPLILGVSLPEPHALAVKPDGTWWSWGQPFHPADWPDLVIEEAWSLCL